MDKPFSISEIIKASDDILNTPSKSSKINNIKITKNNYSSPLLLVNEVSKNASPKANMSFINNLNKNNININEKIKNEIINELYNFFKKKIKKNTLKLIFDQQIKIKKFQKEIEYLNESKKILENNNHDLQSNLNQIIEDKKILENNNHDLQSSLDKIIEEKEMLIEKNTRAQEELSLEKSNLLNNSNNEKLTELNNKLKFYQDENLRLSRDLSNSQETHHIIKKQLNNKKLLFETSFLC